MEKTHAQDKRGEFGIYRINDEEYRLNTLTVRRFQQSLKLLSAVPVGDLVEKLIPDKGTAEIGIQEITDAIFNLLPKIEDEDFFSRLISIAVSKSGLLPPIEGDQSERTFNPFVTPDEAAEFPAGIGLRIATDFFTLNLDLLIDTLNISKVESESKSEKSNGNPSAQEQATPRSSPGSGSSKKSGEKSPATIPGA